MTDPTEELIGDHQRYMTLVVEVESRLQGRLRDHVAARALQASLSALKDGLSSHFAKEEGGHLYQQVPLLKPRFAERLERLRAEHARIVTSIHEALGILDEACKPASDIDRELLERRLRAVVATLRRHEAEETEIILCAHWDDIGGPGD